jgi:hypothetical protein
MSFLRNLVIGVMCLAPAVAFAEWTGGQRSEFRDDCISTCSTNPRVPPAQKKNCPIFCECYQTGAEAQFPDYDALNRELSAAAADSDLRRRFSGIAPTCNKKAFPN